MNEMKEPETGTTEARDQRMLNELASELKKIEDTQNRVLITEFQEFRALFSIEESKNLTRFDIQVLSTRFARRFNIYKPIDVYDVDGRTLLFRVPQLLVPIKDVAPEYVNAVDKFRSEGVSDIPRYASEAVSGLVTAILKSQVNVEAEGYASYGEYIKELSNQYQTDKQSFPKNNNEVVASEGTTSEEINDPDSIQGISWK